MSHVNQKSTTGKSSSDDKTPHFSGFQVPTSLAHMSSDRQEERPKAKTARKEGEQALKESFDSSNLSSYQNVDSSSRDKKTDQGPHPPQDMGRKSDEITDMGDQININDSKGTEKPQERLSFLIVDSGS